MEEYEVLDPKRHITLRDFQTAMCTDCDAEPGQPCRDEDGTEREYGIHVGRTEEYFRLHRAAETGESNG